MANPTPRYEAAVVPSAAARSLSGATIHLARPSSPFRSLCGLDVDSSAVLAYDRGCARCLAVVRDECSPEERVAFDAIDAAQRSLR